MCSRRLVRDDSQWRECLEEASELRLPAGIRLLFCNIIINCPVSNPSVLLETFTHAMSEDFIHQLQNVPNLSE